MSYGKTRATASQVTALTIPHKNKQLPGVGLNHLRCGILLIQHLRASDSAVMAINQIEVVLRKRVGTYLSLAEIIRLNQSEKLIHDFRVASRELIALESILLIAGAKKKPLRKIKTWLKAFGTLRNIQVLQIRCAGSPALQTVLQQELNTEISALDKTLKKVANNKFKVQLREALETAVETSLAESAVFNNTILNDWLLTVDKLHKAVSKLNAEDPHSLHKVRIRFKRLRYLIQFLIQSHLINIQIKKTDLKYWQDKLGSIQDLAMSIEWLAKQKRTKTLQRKLLLQLQLKCANFVAESDKFTAQIEKWNGRVQKALA